MRLLVRFALILIGLGGVVGSCAVQFDAWGEEVFRADDPDHIPTPTDWTFYVVYAGWTVAVFGVIVGKGSARPKTPPRPRPMPLDRPERHGRF